MRAERNESIMKRLWVRVIVAWVGAVVVVGTVTWTMFEREAGAFQKRELVRLESTMRSAESAFRNQTNQAFSELLRDPQLVAQLRLLNDNTLRRDFVQGRALLTPTGARASQSLRSCCGASLHVLDQYGRALIHQPAPGAGPGTGVPALPWRDGMYAAMGRHGVEGLDPDMPGTAYRRVLPIWRDGTHLGVIEASMSPGQYLTMLQRNSSRAWKHHLFIDVDALPDQLSDGRYQASGLHSQLVEPATGDAPPAGLPGWIAGSRSLGNSLAEAMPDRGPASALLRNNRGRQVAVSMMPIEDFRGVTIGYVLAESPADAMDILAARMAMTGAIIVLLLGFLLTIGILLQHQRHRAGLLRERLAAVTESVGEGVCLVSADQRIAYVNKAARDLLGWGDRELVGLDAGWVLQSGPHDVIRGTVESRMRQAIVAGDVYRSDLEGFRRGDGEMLSVAVTATPLRDFGNGQEMVVVFRDVSERARELRLMRAQAMRDPLTGLPNRRVFDERLTQEVRRSRRDGGALSLLMIDVDRFKAFNDYFGHPAGDRALRQIADAMQASMLRPLDAVCRYGGEEFVALLPDTGQRSAERVAERLRVAVAGLAIPQAPGGGAKVLTVSIGEATIMAGHPDSVALLADADTALYEAKAAGGNQVVVSPLRASAQSGQEPSTRR